MKSQNNPEERVEKLIERAFTRKVEKKKLYFRNTMSAYDANPSLFHLSAITQGDSLQQRSGNKVQFRRVEVR